MNVLQLDDTWYGETRSIPEDSGESADWIVQVRDETKGSESLADWFEGARVRSETELDRWFKGLEKGAEGSTLFVASTDDSDRHGDVVEQSTWRLANFRRNPVILHEHGGGLFGGPPVILGRGVARIATVGKADEARKQLQIRVFWDDHPSNPEGQRAAHQHRDGFKHAGSVGFRPGKAISRRDLADDHPAKVGRDGRGQLFRHNELLEFSSVAIPANPQALQLNSLVRSLGGLDGIKSLAKGQAIDRGILSEVVKEILLAELKGNDELRSLIKHLCWGTPPASTSTKGGALSHLFGGSQ